MSASESKIRIRNPDFQNPSYDCKAPSLHHASTKLAVHPRMMSERPPRRACCSGEPPLLSKRELQRRCAAGPSAATMPTSPELMDDGSSHCQQHASLQRHADVQQQHGDHGWTEPTFTAPRARSQLPISNAFEFLDEPKCTE